MKRSGIIAIGLVVLAGVIGSILIIHVPAGSVDIVESSAGDGSPRPLLPGFHWRPIGATITRYETLQAEITGETTLRSADGVALPASFTVHASLDAEKVIDLHPAMHGRPFDRFLEAQAASLLRKFSRGFPAPEILTPEFRARAAGTITDAMTRGGLSGVALEIALPTDATLLAAAEFLAPGEAASQLRTSVTESLQAQPASWRLYTAMGLINESERLVAQAETNYLDALGIDPGALPPMQRLVAIYTAVGEWEKLHRVLDAALTANPQSIPHINWTGLVLLEREDFVGAERIFKSGLALEPENTTLLMNLASVYLKSNRVEEATPLFERAVEADPNNSRALFNLGNALAATEKYEDALGYLERAEQAGSMTYPLAHALALVHHGLGHQDLAKKYAGEAERIKKGATRGPTSPAMPPMGATSPG